MLKLTQENLPAKKVALMRQICYALIKPGLVGFVNAQITPLSSRRQQNTTREYTDQLCSPRNNGTMLKVLSKWQLYFTCYKAICDVAAEKPPLGALYAVILLQGVFLSQAAKAAYPRKVINLVTNHIHSEGFLSQAHAICDYSTRLLAACVAAGIPTGAFQESTHSIQIPGSSRLAIEAGPSLDGDVGQQAGLGCLAKYTTSHDDSELLAFSGPLAQYEEVLLKGLQMVFQYEVFLEALLAGSCSSEPESAHLNPPVLQYKDILPALQHATDFVLSDPPTIHRVCPLRRIRQDRDTAGCLLAPMLAREAEDEGYIVEYGHEVLYLVCLWRIFAQSDPQLQSILLEQDEASRILSIEDALNS